jgi:hypothetical protein
MADPYITLAMTAATTIVAAMATSVWDTAKNAIANMFRRHAQQEIETRLDRSAERVRAAGESEVVRDTQIARWREDIEDLVRDHPHVEDELRKLVDEIQTQLPPVQQRWMIQHIEARDGGIAAGSLGLNSSVVIHQHASSEQKDASAPAEGTS